MSVCPAVCMRILLRICKYRFPASLVLWKGRGLTGVCIGWKPMTTDLGNLGNKLKGLKNTRIITLSLLGTKIWRFFWNIACDATPRRKTMNIGGAQMREESLWSFARSASW
ncbi:hypothetical protein AVEN_218321-1 [Araneus ventricosus]|uniref:Uncharacterized protein n=1 Tax=Araneus ventricosus TaxID=182803 RepID=A0A4Y2HWK3_ARAVE|nr:hypothetical protein AVEN_218321-1 [Araneus ventricosus]